MAASWEDYKILDHPSLLDFIFYPRPDAFTLPDSVTVQNLDLSVEDDITISCTFYFGDKYAANMLFFHGNGELAGEYLDVGSIFNEAGINLFVADYRGYGRSGGKPTISGMMKDAHSIFKGFKQALADKGFTSGCFIMGRSLGSVSAIELASSYPDEFKGLIIESGFCDVTDLLARPGISLVLRGSGAMVAPGFERVKNIHIPALIIHGEYDSIVPIEEGKKIFDNLASREKKLVIIPEADHNTIFAESEEQYLKELRLFVDRNRVQDKK
jgi:alpha-beta hydrolase superfamily lysophospholipase